MASKIQDDPVKLRDVINVSYNTLFRESSPLELSERYWAMRDAIVQAELLIIRMIKFQFSIVDPYKVRSRNVSSFLSVTYVFNSVIYTSLDLHSICSNIIERCEDGYTHTIGKKFL